MTTSAFAHELNAGETLIADVSLMRAPFGWTADVPSGVTVEYRFSISEDAENWVEPAQNGSITEDVADYELDSLRWMRFRHTGGAGAATIRMAGQGRVEWSVS